MTILPTPIDFSQTVYAEAETYADVDFWNLKDWKHLDAAGSPTDLAFSEVVVDRVPVKVLYTIHWQELPRAAIVTTSYDDGSHTGKRKEETNTYDIVKFQGRDVILVRNAYYDLVSVGQSGSILLLHVVAFTLCCHLASFSCSSVCRLKCSLKNG